MKSIIFSAVARPLAIIMLVVSLYIFYRGHNEPGGGFVGGLIAALSFTVIGMAHGMDSARRALRLHPMVLVGIGAALAALSGLPGLFVDGAYLAHQWVRIAGMDQGTTLLFDAGVYLVVLGGIFALIVRFYEDI